MTLKQQQEALKQDIKNIKTLLNGSVDQCELACQLLIGHQILADISKLDILENERSVFNIVAQSSKSLANKHLAEKAFDDEQQALEKALFFNTKARAILKAEMEITENLL